MKRLRLDLQSCLGLADVFGEELDDFSSSSPSLVTLCDQIPEGGDVSDERLQLSLRAAVASGKLLETVEKLNSDAGESSTKNVAQVLLSDLTTNPFANQNRRGFFSLFLFFFFLNPDPGFLSILVCGRRFLECRGLL